MHCLLQLQVDGTYKTIQSTANGDWWMASTDPPAKYWQKFLGKGIAIFPGCHTNSKSTRLPDRIQTQAYEHRR